MPASVRAVICGGCIIIGLVLIPIIAAWQEDWMTVATIWIVTDLLAMTALIIWIYAGIRAK